MRTIDQLHQAAMAITSASPKGAMQVVAGELADVVNLTAAIVNDLPSGHAAKTSHGQYSYANNHQADMPLVIGASKLLLLISLLKPEMATLPPE